MSTIAANIAAMIDMLPENDQLFAKEFVKKLVKAWDPDFTKLTDKEAQALKEAEKDEFIKADQIDWNDLSKYV